MFNINFILSTDIFLAFAKIFFLVLVLFLSIFLFVVLRQITMMIKIVNDSSDAGILKLTSIILLVLSVSLFVAAFVIL